MATGGRCSAGRLAWAWGGREADASAAGRRGGFSAGGVRAAGRVCEVPCGLVPGRAADVELPAGADVPTPKLCGAWLGAGTAGAGGFVTGGGTSCRTIAGCGVRGPAGAGVAWGCAAWGGAVGAGVAGVDVARVGAV